MPQYRNVNEFLLDNGYKCENLDLVQYFEQDKKNYMENLSQQSK